MPHNISRVTCFCGLLILAATSEGCQRGPMWNLVPVKGTVTKDGRPLAGIQVIFWPDVEAGTQGPRTSDFTDSAGHYHLRTDTGDRGAAIGRYRVILCVPENERMNGSRDKNRPQQVNQPKDKAAKPAASNAVQLPPAYSSFQETPLRVEVHPGPQTLDFAIP